MRKRIFGVIIALCVVMLAGFTGYAVWRDHSSQAVFASGGYVLQGEALESKQLTFLAQEPYKLSSSGTVKFRTSGGEQAVVQQESFVHFDNGSVMAMSDGILVDFDDLSENFINNYYISAGLSILAEGDRYAAETTAGTISFGDHLWKLSDTKYLVQSPAVTVVFGESDRREVGAYVQVSITDDGIVQLLTEENLWMTLSEDCYIETASGVRVYPVRQIIEDSNYKMSIAKLAINPDDSIILTEDETRRQIVPELTINTIDGEDGVDGEAGLAGELGIDGEDGRDGVDGLDGERGEDGEDGRDGENGKYGEKGDDGDDGDDGANGMAGFSGSSGSDGGNGGNGVNGSGGEDGSNGKDGNNAMVDSSTNTALPVMTFSAWQVSATALRGTISVVDDNLFLSALDADKNYSASVTIYNVETGDVVYCYPIETLDQEIIDESIGTAFPKLNRGTGSVHFATQYSALTPDTQYRISVYAYYKVNETIYSREFISRVFYTDSTGVFLTAEPSTSSSVTVSASVPEAYQDSVISARIILLTPDQNEGYKLDGTGYEKAEVLTGLAQGSQEVTFTGLPSDTNYIARVEVTTADGVTTLTKQELPLCTLKTTPTWAGIPLASYNRVTGGYEVWRPAVTDPDGGAVSYVYTALNPVGDVVSTRTVKPSEGEPAVFFLPSGTSYSFSVTMHFDDNEKTVSYDLGVSESVLASGSTMPGVRLDYAPNQLQYNKLHGSVIINLSDESVGLKVDSTKPLKLRVYADQIYDRTIEILTDDGKEYTGTAGVGTQIWMGSYTAQPGVSNEANIVVELDQLYGNTNYTITVEGYLDLGDGNGYSLRTIGTVSFRTPAPPALTVSFQPGSGSGAITRNFRIVADDSTVDSTSNTHAAEQLRGGEIILELYTGTGYGATLLATASITEEGDLEKIYGSSGLEISEGIFGDPRLIEGADYTLKVGSVADGSYALETDLGYVNYFTRLNNASEHVVSRKSPPDLLTDPAQGILETVIYNANAEYYGGSYDPNLPDDAVVGFALEAQYDNTQRMATSVTYYAMEYQAFYNSVLAGVDPIQTGTPENNNWLVYVTEPVDFGSDSVPKVAFLFGGTAGQSLGNQHGYWAYYAGPASAEGNILSSGMDRGYRYIFAYTVEYVDEDTTYTYPYDHTDQYEDWKYSYGVGKEFGNYYGQGLAYVLNSGMCEAPRVTPTFYTYLYQLTDVAMDNKGDPNSPSSGNAVIHYAWSDDPDGTISIQTGSETQIVNSAGGRLSYIDDVSVNGDSELDWYSVTVPYRVSPGATTIVAPIVDIDIYFPDYDSMMDTLRNYETVDENVYLTQIPVDWSWNEYFGADNRKEEVEIWMDTSSMADNYIRFELSDKTTGSTLSLDLGERAFALKVTVTTTSGTPQVEKTFYLEPVLDTRKNVYYAVLSTGEMGIEFYQREFKVTAKVLYDGGDQGWILADESIKDNGMIALENITTNMGDPGFSGYYVRSSAGYQTTATSPANGLLSISSSTVNMLGTSTLTNKFRQLPPEEENLVSVRFNMWNLNAAESLDSFQRNLRPTQKGIDGSSTGNLSDRSLTVKGVAEYPAGDNSFLTFNGDDTATLDTITPTIVYGSYVGGVNFVTISSFTVQKAGQEVNEVTVGLFVEEDDALAPNFDAEALEEALVSGTELETLPLNAAGVNPGGFQFTGLPQGDYYLAFFYKAPDGTLKHLLDASTADKAVYHVKTSEFVDVTSETNVVYENLGYFDKTLRLKFNLSRALGITMRYDFYRNQADAEAAVNPIQSLTHESMTAPGGIMTAPGSVASSGNEVKWNLTPSILRGDLTPGATYYLRVTAQETVDGAFVEAGYKVFPVELTAIGNVNAFIYAETATADSITFRVTISDPEYSIMGSKDYENGSGLYTVRFVYIDKDGNEHRLATAYDEFVYSANEPRKVFVLNNDVLVHKGGVEGQEIVSGGTYRMYVYAVVDEQHTDQSPDMDNSGTRWSWSDVFGSLREGRLGDLYYKISDALNNLINSFWDNLEAKTDAATQSLIARFRKGAKEQMTTGGDGVRLNTAAAVLTRSTATQFRLLLPESFGLLNGTEQVYEKISWDITSTSGAFYRGDELKAEGDTMIEAIENNPDYKYYFDIPQSVPSGNYQINISFYKNADSEEHVTLSFTYYG